MDYKYIEQLIERYFQAETTLQEEQILRTFFAQAEEELPGSLAVYAPLFATLAEKETLGDDFDKRMLQMTGNDTPADTVTVKARTIKLTDRLRPLFKAAAVVAILLTLGQAINQSLQAVDEWVEPAQYAEVPGEQQGDGENIALNGVTIDSATLIGQVQLSDSLKSDTLSLQY